MAALDGGRGGGGGGGSAVRESRLGIRRNPSSFFQKARGALRLRGSQVNISGKDGQPTDIPSSPSLSSLSSVSRVSTASTGRSRDDVPGTYREYSPSRSTTSSSSGITMPNVSRRKPALRTRDVVNKDRKAVSFPPGSLLDNIIDAVQPSSRESSPEPGPSHPTTKRQSRTKNKSESDLLRNILQSNSRPSSPDRNKRSLIRRSFPDLLPRKKPGSSGFKVTKPDDSKQKREIRLERMAKRLEKIGEKSVGKGKYPAIREALKRDLDKLAENTKKYALPAATDVSMLVFRGARLGVGDPVGHMVASVAGMLHVAFDSIRTYLLNNTLIAEILEDYVDEVDSVMRVIHDGIGDHLQDEIRDELVESLKVYFEPIVDHCYFMYQTFKEIDNASSFKKVMTRDDVNEFVKRAQRGVTYKTQRLRLFCLIRILTLVTKIDHDFKIIQEIRDELRWIRNFFEEYSRKEREGVQPEPKEWGPDRDKEIFEALVKKMRFSPEDEVAVVNTCLLKKARQRLKVDPLSTLKIEKSEIKASITLLGEEIEKIKARRDAVREKEKSKKLDSATAAFEIDYLNERKDFAKDAIRNLQDTDEGKVPVPPTKKPDDSLRIRLFRTLYDSAGSPTGLRGRSRSLTPDSHSRSSSPGQHRGRPRSRSRRPVKSSKSGSCDRTGTTGSRPGSKASSRSRSRSWRGGIHTRTSTDSVRSLSSSRSSQQRGPTTGLRSGSKDRARPSSSRTYKSQGIQTEPRPMRRGRIPWLFAAGLNTTTEKFDDALWNPSICKICDVGYVNSDGRFIRLFNATRHNEGKIELLERIKTTSDENPPGLHLRGSPIIRRDLKDVKQSHVLLNSQGKNRAFMCLENARMSGIKGRESWEKAMSWFGRNAAKILHAHQKDHINLSWSNLIMVTGKLDARYYALLLNFSEPSEMIYFHEFERPQSDELWGTFATYELDKRVRNKDDEDRDTRENKADKVHKIQDSISNVSRVPRKNWLHRYPKRPSVLINILQLEERHEEDGAIYNVVRPGHK